MKKRRFARRAGLALALSFVLTACASDAELDTLDTDGKYARHIQNLFWPVFWIGVAVFVIVFGAVLYNAARYRVKEHRDGDWPNQVHGHNALEIAWTIVPAIILIGIAVPSLATLFKLTDNVPREERDVAVVVVGQQWWWEFRYYFGDNARDYDPKVDKLDGRKPDLVTAGQLVMPVQKDIQLFITSRDVIHSFWIPQLNGKKDAVPGRFHDWKIQANNPGVYFGQCTEFCGLSHSRMRMQAIALTDADFTKWVADQQKPWQPTTPALTQWLSQQRLSAAQREAAKAGGVLLADPNDPEKNTAVERGAVSFRNICTKCHLVAGLNDDIYAGFADQVAGKAPELTHFASRTTYAGGIFNLYNADGSLNRNQLEAWLRNPPAEKDAYAEGKRGMPALGLSEAQIDDLVEFLMTTGEPPNKAETIPATEVK